MAGYYVSSSVASCSARCVAQSNAHDLNGSLYRQKVVAAHSIHRDGTVSALHQPSCPRGVKSTYLGERLGHRLVYIRGAPEALLVGVVALIVFGPRGLAEAVKALGNTLRTFQPTIRELASVSSELRNTLEEQIGLDQIRQELRSATLPPPTRPVFTDMPKTVEQSSEGRAAAEKEGTLQDVKTRFLDEDPDIERKRAESAAIAWGGSSGSPPDLGVQAASPRLEQRQPAPATQQLASMTVEELEAELARRKAGDKAKSA